MFNMGVGDSHAVREALSHYTSTEKLMLCSPYLGYGDPKGDRELEDRIRSMVLRSTGTEYRHVVVTSGAHMGVAAALLAMERRLRSSEVHYDRLHFFKYPQLVRALNMIRVDADEYMQRGKNVILLTASPSNPTGLLNLQGHEGDTIWDACYHNEIYTSPIACEQLPRPEHLCMVGSLGKVTGINGLRVGWVATSDQSFADDVRQSHYNLALTTSTICAEVAKNFFRTVDTDAFFHRAWGYLCDNRYQLSKLEYLFDVPVPEYGMFWFVRADAQARELLLRAGVTFIEGTECGGTPDQVRLTVGQRRDVTAAMVRAVLKEDGR